MKLRWILLGFFAMGLYLMRDIEPEPDVMPIYMREDIVGHNWDENRYITKSMADTMIFTGGKWYNRSEVPIGTGSIPTTSTHTGPLDEDDVMDIIELNKYY